MKVVDIVPKQICVNMEFSEIECHAILDFFDKAVPLYKKVHFDAEIDHSLSVVEDFDRQLKSVTKTIKEETERNDS